jgi:hypothetical protein
MDVTSYSMMQLFLWFIIILVFIFMVVYIYINEKEKHESMKLSEEEAIVEEIVRKHPYQGKSAHGGAKLENEDIY